jgi:thiamine biosynthesis lipoprotein
VLAAGLIAGAVVILSATMLWYVTREVPTTHDSGQAMGTTWHITLRWSDSPGAMDLNAIGFANAGLNRVDTMCSTWRDDSEIMRFNAHHSSTPFEVSKYMAQLVDRAQQIAAETDGAFDPTIGPVTKRWITNDLSNYNHTPDATAHIGYSHLTVSLDPPALTKHDPELQLDLSAIAKGYAVDRIHDHIDFFPSLIGGMVEVGGEVGVWGDRPWSIAIESPVAGRREVLTVVELKNQAMATSGDYRQQRQVDGETVTHIVDPRTGRSIGRDLASVSVVDESCATADALATALMVMGADEGYDFCVEHDIAALFVTRDGDVMKVKRTPVWDRDVIERGAMPRR